MRGRKKEAYNRWYNNRNKTCRFLFKSHEWICYWHCMCKQRYRCN